MDMVVSDKILNVICGEYWKILAPKMVLCISGCLHLATPTLSLSLLSKVLCVPLWGLAPLLYSILFYFMRITCIMPNPFSHFPFHLFPT